MSKFIIPNDPKIKIQSDVELASFTSFKLGGKVKGLIHCEAALQVQLAVKELNDANIPFIIIGRGSNIVVSDKGLDCYVIRFVGDSPIFQRDNNDIIASGCADLDVIVQYSVQQGLGNLCPFSGIPGTLGGAIYGNAGAFGRQISEYLSEITVLTKDGNIKKMKPEELEFSYRDSLLKRTNDIVLAARFTLNPMDHKELENERISNIEQRRNKHPDWKKERCAGSFFKNVYIDSEYKRKSAGFYLDEVGAKDMRVNGAFVFSKHANIIMADDNATAQDILDLSAMMEKKVNEKFSLKLQREVQFVGEFDGAQESLENIIW